MTIELPKDGPEAKLFEELSELLDGHPVEVAITALMNVAALSIVNISSTLQIFDANADVFCFKMKAAARDNWPGDDKTRVN